MLAPATVVFIGGSPEASLAILGGARVSEWVYAVNPKYTEVLGVPGVGSVDDLPAGDVDLAFVAVSTDRALGGRAM